MYLYIELLVIGSSGVACVRARVSVRVIGREGLCVPACPCVCVYFVVHG